MAGAGAALAAARTAAGRSQDDVSAVTRIRPAVIAAVEAEDWAACGGPVYARGHLRALARALGVDPAPLLAQLPAAALPAPQPRRAVRERRVGSRWTTTAALGLGILGCLAGLRVIVPTGPPNPVRHPSALTSTGRSPSPVASSTRLQAPTAGAAVTVVVRVVGARSWVAVKGSDGRSRIAEVLTRGQQVSFRDAQRLSVVLGDATAVELAVNGRPVATSGGHGGVQRLVLEPSSGGE